MCVCVCVCVMTSCLLCFTTTPENKPENTTFSDKSVTQVECYFTLLYFYQSVHAEPEAAYVTFTLQSAVHHNHLPESSVCAVLSVCWTHSHRPLSETVFHHLSAWNHWICLSRCQKNVAIIGETLSQFVFSSDVGTWLLSRWLPCWRRLVKMMF